MLNRATAAAVIVALALAGCASTPPAPRTTPPTAHNVAPTTCVATPTGLLAPPRNCAGAGHTWTQNQISRTGAQTTAGALRLLDPTITVTGQ